ncbi:MAG: hypothetical protein ACJ71B_11425, partial [Nitrososphaera sp.]
MIVVRMGDSILEDFDDFQLITDKKSSKSSIYNSSLVAATETIDCYLSQLSKSEPTFSSSLFEFLRTADKKKNIRVRIITVIKSENIELAKELARQFTIYHTDASGGDFCIIDGATYLYEIENSNHKMGGYHRQLVSKNHTFVKLQHDLFENLLNHATPARDKIKELEQGIQREYIKTIQDPSSILQLV